MPYLVLVDSVNQRGESGGAVNHSGKRRHRDTLAPARRSHLSGGAILLSSANQLVCTRTSDTRFNSSGVRFRIRN